MLADGKAPPAPPYYGIIEKWEWGGARNDDQQRGRWPRSLGEKRGVVTTGAVATTSITFHPRTLQSRLIVTALGRHRPRLRWCLARKRIAISNVCSNSSRCVWWAEFLVLVGFILRSLLKVVLGLFHFLMK